MHLAERVSQRVLEMRSNLEGLDPASLDPDERIRQLAHKMVARAFDLASLWKQADATDVVAQAVAVLDEAAVPIIRDPSEVAAIEQSLGWAQAGHTGQFRADGKTPYIVHPILATVLFLEVAHALNLDHADVITTARIILMHDIHEKSRDFNWARMMIEDVARRSSDTFTVDMGIKAVTGEVDVTMMLVLPYIFIWVKLFDRFSNMTDVTGVPPDKYERILGRKIAQVRPGGKLWPLIERLDAPLSPFFTHVFAIIEQEHGLLGFGRVLI